MKKKYSDEVIYLSGQTGISKYRCNIVLEECAGDINLAFAALEEISSNKYEKAMDNISALVRGERGSVIYVKEAGEIIFRLPVAVVIALMLLLDVPSWVVAVVLLLFTVFATDVEMRSAEKREDKIKTVRVDEYTRKKNIQKQIEYKRKNPSAGSDGYNEIIID